MSRIFRNVYINGGLVLSRLNLIDGNTFFYVRAIEVLDENLEVTVFIPSNVGPIIVARARIKLTVFDHITEQAKNDIIVSELLNSPELKKYKLANFLNIKK